MELDRLLALWEEGVVGDDQVVAWADDAIARSPDGAELPQWLMKLSISGVRACLADPDCDLPSPLELTLEQRFALRATFVDLSSESSVLGFCRWAAEACIGEDLDLPEVVVGYQIDHSLEDDTEEAIRVARQALADRMPEYLRVSSALLGDNES